VTSKVTVLGTTVDPQVHSSKISVLDDREGKFHEFFELSSTISFGIRIHALLTFTGNVEDIGFSKIPWGNRHHTDAEQAQIFCHMSYFAVDGSLPGRVPHLSSLAPQQQYYRRV